MIAMECPGCGRGLKVKDDLAGRKVKCPGCGKAIAVPPSQTNFLRSQVKPAAASVAEEKTLPPRSAPKSEVGGPVSQAAGEGKTAPENRKLEVTQSFLAPEVSSELTEFLAPPEKPDEIGRLGPYRILKVLGAGGMGVVFQAEDPQLERTVAVKAMLPSLAATPSARQRFLREAKTAAAIKHDNIIHIYQVGEDRGAPYLAMEFLEGEPLDARLKREKNFSLAEMLCIGREIARGLAAAHEKGLIHRDIKPANIWLESVGVPPSGGAEPVKAGTPPARVKILDFGLARAAADDSHLTQTGAIVGTPAYMAPEQGAGEKVDQRGDLFSLGCVLYRMCTGELPFKGKDTISILSALALVTPQEPKALNPKIPAGLNDLIMYLLAKNPGDRPKSARAVEEALAALEAGEKPAVPKYRARSRRRLAIVGGATLLAVAGVAAFIIFMGGRNSVTPVVDNTDRSKGGKVPAESNIKAVELPGPAVWKLDQDPRRGKAKDYNGYFPWTPPRSKEAWNKRRQEVREQVLVANGLWPMPPRPPLKPVIHGKIQREGYTVEKVFFPSYPGHYVTGNLYRPTGAPPGRKYAGILCPYGHWPNGRFQEASAQEVKAQLGQGAEKTAAGARNPQQVRCAQLARMGCIVFHYDMVGYGDSKPILHRQGFTDVEAELRLQNIMGLQTFNSIRALDFLVSLPQVDPERIGVTGASGGATQAVILGGVDDRPAAVFPVGMVSTAMQGGCICENCSYLRVGTGNIELAALFAPRPLGMAAANDWTIDIEAKGLPELKALYRLVDAPNNVMARTYPQFGHNFNQVSRELMYNFFNKHLRLGQKEPIVEQPFVPVPPKDLSVFDAKHPLPKDAVDAVALRKYLTKESDRQIQALLPRDAKGLAEFQRVLGTALRVMIADTLPQRKAVISGDDKPRERISYRKVNLGRPGEVVPGMLVTRGPITGMVVVWVHPDGLSSLWAGPDQLATGVEVPKVLVPAAQQMVDKGAAILAVEVFRTGLTVQEPMAPVNKTFAGYTFGYNRPLLANRVHDILSAVAFGRDLPGVQTVHLLGFEKAGPWVVVARGLCGNAVSRTAADFNQFRFDRIFNMDDEMMLPGAVKYGGLPALASLAAPHELYLYNTKDAGSDSWLRAAYAAAARPDHLHWQLEAVPAKEVVSWLLR